MEYNYPHNISQHDFVSTMVVYNRTGSN